MRGLAREMDTAISGFVRGQALVCLILGCHLFGRPDRDRRQFRIADRHRRGVPELCAVYRNDHRLHSGGRRRAGAILAGLDHAGAWRAGIFIFGQFIEGNILQPLLVGEEIGLHPVWLMFALIAFGVSVRVCRIAGRRCRSRAAIGVLVRFMLRQYLASPSTTGNQQG